MTIIGVSHHFFLTFRNSQSSISMGLSFLAIVYNMYEWVLKTFGFYKLKSSKIILNILSFALNLFVFQKLFKHLFINWILNNETEYY